MHFSYSRIETIKHQEGVSTMKKKICSILALFVVLFSLSFTAFASSARTFSQDYTIVEDDMIASTISLFSTNTKIVRVSDIQKLLDERTSALLNHDQQAYNEITNTLRAYGVNEIAFEDIDTLLGDNFEPVTYGAPNQTSTTKNSVFEYYYTTYTYGGVTYDVMRILASPNMNTVGDTVLYHSGSMTLYNSKPSTLIGMNLLKIGITSLIGTSNGGSVLVTLYDAVDAVHSGLSSSAKVSNVQANYQWNLAEDCSWIYVSKKGESNYKLSGRYHKGSMGVLVGVPKLVVNGMNSTAYINSVNRQLTAVPKNYDSTYYAVRTFASGKVGVYESYISSLPVVGLEGKTVATAVLSNPFYPVYAQ